MKYLWKILAWVELHQLVFCFVCKRLLFMKDAKYETMSMGIAVPLCKKCREALYSPYTHWAKEAKLNKIKNFIGSSIFLLSAWFMMISMNWITVDKSRLAVFDEAIKLGTIAEKSKANWKR